MPALSNGRSETAVTGTMKATRGPTLQAWVGLQPVWLVVGLVLPHSSWPIYGSVPVGFGIAWVSARWNLLRTPTAVGLVGSAGAYLVAVALGIHQTAAVAFGQVNHKLIVSVAMIAGYGVQELRHRVPAWGKSIMRFLAAGISSELAASGGGRHVDVAADAANPVAAAPAAGRGQS